VTVPCEVLAVYDTAEDSTAAPVAALAARDARVFGVLNTYGRGPAKAIRFGIDVARAPVVVVTMADSSDDPSQIEQLVALVERGAVVAAASRYMSGGRQVGGPLLKKLMSRTAGLTLYAFARVGVHDATNSFKAYDARFLQDVGIDSTAGFEIGLELVAKARRYRRPVAEIPTVWQDRTNGASNFQLRRWLGAYLRWYVYAYGPALQERQTHSSQVAHV